ncbi:hypothetical protein CA850_26090 [Micromonospora echinospora]|uniref:Neocarzinostatin family protein n=1 Tax=Micromonospora echinospora TaxID=1877 RepID=A0A1C4VN61_MICEC|nr:hypothetical protein [Micromonospora echinospora]OZV76697.1 hypothetical protein CA850_26090 [Micromonospora echinospora]SCE85442.1 hypothetical protein GA0070618_1411 [Micromonospora echinospora]
MISRLTGTASSLALLAAIGLSGAAPAQAAAPGALGSAAITVDAIGASSSLLLHVGGTVTCSAATGTAEITAIGGQVMPWAMGSASVTVPCAAGPVPWEVTIVATWTLFHDVTVNALMGDSNGGAASVSVLGSA